MGLVALILVWNRVKIQLNTLFQNESTILQLQYKYIKALNSLRQNAHKLLETI